MKNKGITLVALMVTIVVLMILAGVSIAVLLGDDGIIEQAKASKFKAMGTAYLEDLDTYMLDQMLLNNENVINTSIDLPITNIIPDIKEEYEDNFLVKANELYFKYDLDTEKEVKEAKWAEEIGIKTTYEVIISESEFTEQDDVWAYAPDITGFNPDTTYYVTYDESGNEIRTNIGTRRAPLNWYNYSESSKLWGNVVTTNGTEDVYLVWIPRYRYKIIDDNLEIQYCNLNDEYFDMETKKLIPNTEGYLIPEAFKVNTDNVDGAEQELKGFWVGKYEINESLKFSQTTIQRTDVSNQIKATFAGCDVNTYKFYLDGNLLSENTTGIYTFENVVQDVPHTIKVEGINNASGKVIEVEKILAVASEKTPCAPDISGFEKDSTWYLTYNEAGEEVRTSFNEPAPANWYDYSMDSKKWANVVASNGTEDVYLVWIPRYQYVVDEYNDLFMEFIPQSQLNAIYGYNIPAAFSVDMSDTGEDNKILTGFWTGKYEISDDLKFSKTTIQRTEVSNQIKATFAGHDINTYKFYLDGELISKNTNGTYIFENVVQDVPHTIKVEGINDFNGLVIEHEKILAVASEKTPCAPDITGFEKDSTWYLTYNEAGEEVRTSFNEPAPADWYDYSMDSKKWANVVASNGTEEVYLVWIPRYQYVVDEYNDLFMEFIPVTQTMAIFGYNIPQAFRLDTNNDDITDKELSGFWAGKYEISE